MTRKFWTVVVLFLSTPSGWRATKKVLQMSKFTTISIHALRVEGDAKQSDAGGGGTIFLSTPSGWRATHARKRLFGVFAFLSTPSGWRATK